METIVERVTTYNQLFEAWTELGNQHPIPLKIRLNNFSLYIEKLFNFAENYIVKVRDELAGAISFYNNDTKTNIAFISQICTIEKYRKNGIGTLLLKICEDKAKQNRMKAIRLEVKKDNHNAIKFYFKNGFYQKGDSASSYYMEKEI